ncbi:MAG: hypothetical protein IJV10_04100 [Prevotella sp.]|nr:hypothetical protein [Prevotella sp.]
MLRRLYILVTVAVVSLMMTANTATPLSCAESGTPAEQENEEVTASQSITATEGTISEAPQVPQTVPVRRLASTTSSGSMSLSRIVRPCYNLTLKQLATYTDVLLHSQTSKHSDVFTGAASPYNCSRACEYYVFALRSIII